MQEYMTRLKKLYYKIQKCELVLSKSTDMGAQRVFAKLLNESLPQNADETEIKLSFRRLFLNNREGFLSCIKKSPYYIFLTDGREICFHFGLQYLIYIKWDNTYKISLYQQKYHF